MKINEEIIERLTIDRACGELSDDAATLLNAWFDENPLDKKIADKITATYNLTESTVQQNVDPIHNSNTASPKPTTGLSRISRFLPHLTQAAIILIALTLGLWLGQLTNPANHTDPPAQQ